jgi:hypothetical protein
MESQAGMLENNAEVICATKHYQFVAVETIIILEHVSQLVLTVVDVDK